MEASGVHQLVAQVEQTMQKETTSFTEIMYKYVDDSAGQLEKTLAAYWERDQSSTGTNLSITAIRQSNKHTDRMICRRDWRISVCPRSNLLQIWWKKRVKHYQ